MLKRAIPASNPLYQQSAAVRLQVCHSHIATSDHPYGPSVFTLRTAIWVDQSKKNKAASSITWSMPSAQVGNTRSSKPRLVSLKSAVAGSRKPNRFPTIHTTSALQANWTWIVPFRLSCLSCAHWVLFGLHFVSCHVSLHTHEPRSDSYVSCFRWRLPLLGLVFMGFATQNLQAIGPLHN